MTVLALLIVLSLALGVAAWGFFVWTVRSGQYEDPEGAKYRMLEDDEPSRPPAAGPGQSPREDDGDHPAAGATRPSGPGDRS